MNSAAKKRIRASFDRAATTYDDAAIVQRRICESLLKQTADSAQAVTSILDAGCGTGYALPMLRERWPSASITAADFAFSMLKQLPMKPDMVFSADIEKLPLPAAYVDLWWSNLSIQWCSLENAFREAARVLKPDGQMAFSTLSTGTFIELRKAFEEIDSYTHTLAFSTVGRLQNSLTKAGLRNIVLLREKHTVYYPDLKTLLQAVKAIGANTVGENKRSGMMGKTAWEQVEAAYERYREKEGLPASYDVILGYANK